MDLNNVVVSNDMPVPKTGHFIRCLGWDYERMGLLWEYVPLTALEGRKAICPHCDREQPSSPDLVFFEYRGGDQYDNCAKCGMKQIAHEPGRTGHGHDYEQGPRTTDLYYCGCRGWD